MNKNSLSYLWLNQKFAGMVILLLWLFSLTHPVQAEETQKITASAFPAYEKIKLDTDFLQNVSLDFRDIDITEALKYLATKSHLNIIPTKEVAGRVTLMVENVSLQDVFDIMLRSNSLAYEKQGNIYNVMTEKEYKLRYGKNFSDLRQVKVFQLKYAVPEQASQVIETLKSEIGKVLMDNDSGTVLVMDIPEKIAKIEETISSIEKKNVIRIFNLKYARAKDVETQLKLQLDVKKVGSVKADERTNQLIIQTLPERMEDIEKLIEGLDQKTRQIIIDAKIIQIKLTNALSAGVEWEGLFDLGDKDGLNYLGSYPFSSVTTKATDAWRSRREVLQDVGYTGSYPFSGTTTNTVASKPKTGTEEMHLGVVNDKYDYDTVIKYLRTLGEVRVLSNPKLAVVNNQEAKIHVGEKQAYITTTTTQSQSSTTVAEVLTYVDVGVQLYVTPTINADGFVTIKIKPEISSVISYLETASKNRIPIIDTSAAETIVMVKDGSSILIGGLSKEEKALDQDATPFLSNLPFVGEAFKSRTKKTTRNELMILLTAHIISGDELTTGNMHDFGARMDKEYQDYKGIKEDSPKIDPKSYQGYPNLRNEQDVFPELKPARSM